MDMRLLKRVADLDSLENRDPELIKKLIGLFQPLLWSYFRPEVQGIERIPEGAGLFVGNHNGALLMPDLFIFGIALYERFGLEGLPYGMVHDTGILFPVYGDFFLALGAVRGCERNAHRLLSLGEKVLIYPGGELDSMRSFWNRTRIFFKGRGYIRLALKERVPIIPVVSSGAHETLFVLNDGRWIARTLRMDRWLHSWVWPIVFCLPWGLWVGVPPPHIPFRTRIHVAVLEPIRFESEGPEAAADTEYVEECHQRVHSAMEAVLKRLAWARRRRRRRKR